MSSSPPRRAPVAGLPAWGRSGASSRTTSGRPAGRARTRPARRRAGEGSCDALPPMGLRVRLKGSLDISGFGPQSQVILTALKQYGMLLADNGSPWYVTGAPDGSWDDDELHDPGGISGADFQGVDTSGFV